ncbi:twin-arginine translocase subunit TatC [Pleionea litopenaei]|uniref:Sec-independent protein translocase protein TatC n=1 Tax=Pleionea litopenaei TaxID=3070815 RepID=A0AA51RRS7_9GAMM|nr:twin-arginine translocase subunit TatC [Pleionea sp. HL-JVS1]WMS86436.1 twin-arginine translocase subunit TatC [Pleionea sp. HL-JVS1]
MTEPQSNAAKDESQNSAAEMPLLGHLVELRSRLLKAVITIVVLFLGLVYFANDLYLIVAKPLIAHLPEGSEMVSTSVIAPFFTPFKLSLVLAFFLAIPVVLHQLWAFISPALYQNEKRLAIPLLFSSVVLFYSGMVFCYFIVFPLMFQFFPSVIPEGIRYIPDMTDSLNIMLKLFFAFGVAFEVPIVTMLLVWSGTTTVANLKEKRPYIIVGAFVIGMLLTPPDMISQTLLAVPMWMLFELGLFLATWIKPSPAEKPSDET